MESVIKIFVFIFGSIVGSFLNVCIYRIPKGESIAFPPSHCINCKTHLKAKDLIPIFSYIILRGKCRVCGEKIKVTYPFIELITGLSFLTIYMKFGLDFNFIIYSFLISLLIVISKIDINTMEVYFSLSLVGFIGGIFCFIFNVKKGITISSLGISILLPLLLIGLLVLFTKGNGMGSGDLEIYLMLSLYFPYKYMILILLSSVVLGGLYSSIKLITNKASRKDHIAFVPHIGIATFIVIMFGENIINAYLSMFY